jgi:predicted PurR-regulated permease PerM
MSRRTPLIFLAVALAALVPVLLSIAWPFLTSFLVASILAVVMYPVKEWLSRRTRRPGLATFATTLVVVSVLAAMLTIAGFTLSRELTSAYRSLSESSVESGGWVALITETSDRVVDAVATRIPVDKQAIRAEILARLKTASGYLLSNIDNALGGLTAAVLTIVMVTVFLYFLLRNGMEWVAQIVSMMPLDDRAANHLVDAVRDSIVANVNGVFAAAVGQGLLLVIGFWITGLRSPVLWGGLGGVASVIPVVGAPLVWVPVAIAYLVTGAYWKAIFLGLWGSLLVGSVDNVLRPLVAGARDKQHPVVIALAAIGGTYAFGALGILLGPLTVSLFAAVLEELQPLVAAARSGAADNATQTAVPNTGNDAAIQNARP